MGLDIGRKYTGVALSDKQLKFAKGYKTLTVEFNPRVANTDEHIQFIRALRNVIRNKNVKGIVVGYPLDDEDKPTRHCGYIETFL